MSNSIAKTTITIGIPTRYGGAQIIPTIKSIKGSRDIKIDHFLVVADKTPISTEEKLALGNLGVDLVWNDEEGSWVKKAKQMIRMCKTDILIITQDDVLFEKITVSEIVNTFQGDEKITMVSSVILPLPPKTYFESVLDIGVRIVCRIATLWNLGDNYLSASGRCMSFKTEFLKKIEIPDNIINADAFLYFENKKLGGVMKFASESKVYIDQPMTLREQLGPSSRYQMSKTELAAYYKNDIASEYKVPFLIALRGTLAEFIRSPIRTLLYLSVLVYTRLYRNSIKQASNPLWNRYNSKT